MKRWITVLVVVAVLAAAVIGIGAIRQRQQAASQLASLQTATVELGSLQATVGATGTVRANQTANLNWSTSGTVSAVYAQVGQTVDSGDVLADLRQTSLPQNIILAQADLVNARQALEDLQKGFNQVAIAQAAQTVAAAEQAVEDAERYLNGLNSPVDQTYIDQAEATVVLTREVLDQARKAYEPYENKADSVIKANLQSRLAQAQQEYDAAVRRYNNLVGTASALDIQKAEADLELARAQWADAQEEYDRVLNGASPDELAAAQARVAAAEATLALAHVESPFSGIVTQAEPQAGDLVNGGTPAFRVDDLSRLLVDVKVSEVDINRIEVGQPVVLFFDAILAREYHGQVVEVGLVGQNDQGIISFLVTVELLDPDQDVKPGMTAGVNIVVSQLENVLLVPNRAVRVLDGNRVVYVMRDGVMSPVEIELGASSDSNSEVLGGELVVGDTIVLNPPATFANGPFGGGPGGGQ
ncbi:MAG: efflux RND transporter periplasmic adaptor subunit [Anaerolineae bacterium]|nr:MAG: efflux RND transporter periplasmic adaptor subunit [Anaerolineae bacterium]